MNNKKLIRHIMIPGYLQFAVCILFWIGAGLGLFQQVHMYIYILMAVLLCCCILVIIGIFLLERFYLQNVHESLSNLEKLNLKLRSQRHEYLNEMQVVYGLLELGEYEEAVKYLQPVYADIAKVGKALKTSSPAVNALLQAKMEYADKNQVNLYIEVSSDLSGIRMEQWDLCRILGNLIDNAITAVMQIQKPREVHVHIQEDALNYRYSVYNNGPKIPKEKQQLIFKRGYSSKKEEGHGLGLGIVKDLVASQHGMIHMTSISGKTEFEIVIPK